ERVERDEIVDVYVGPDVRTRTGMRGIAALFRELDQERHLRGVRLDAEPRTIDQARADNDRAAAVVAVREDLLVQRHARGSCRRWGERRILVEHRIRPLAAAARADDARSRCVDEGLAAAGERTEQRID